MGASKSETGPMESARFVVDFGGGQFCPPLGEEEVAGATGLEPATSGVTGRRSNQLNYTPAGVLHLVGETGIEPVTPSL